MLTSHHLPLRATAAAGALMLLISCGGGGDGGGFVVPPIIPTPTPEPAPAPPPAPEMRAISGTLNGLGSGGRLVLQNNAGDDLALTANGEFSFSMQVKDGEPYAVTVGTNPLWQFCTVGNGSGVASASTPSVTVDCAAAQATVTTLAGSGTAGTADGEGTAAEFNEPSGITVDTQGFLYVTDARSELLRKISPSGMVTTLSTSAEVQAPHSPTLDADGNLYLTEFRGNKVRKLAPDGTLITVAGSGAAGSMDGNGAAASFNQPAGLVRDAQDNMFVSEYAGHVIRKIAPNGDVATLAGSGVSGHADGTGNGAGFNGPGGLVMDAEGNLFVAGFKNHVIRKITPDGVVTTPYGMPQQTGSDDGNGSAARFEQPSALAIDSGGSLYVSDFGNRLIRRITPDGTVTTLAGTAGVAGDQDGVGTAASFDGPYALTVDARGNIYVAETRGHRIRKITPTPAP